VSIMDVNQQVSKLFGQRGMLVWALQCPHGVSCLARKDQGGGMVGCSPFDWYQIE